MESNLYALTEAKEMQLTKREELLVENEQVFAEQGLIDWEAIRKELDLQRRYEKRMGVENV